MKRLWNLTGYACVGMWLYGVGNLAWDAACRLWQGDIWQGVGFILGMWLYAVCLDRLTCLCWNNGQGPGARPAQF